MFSDFFSVNGVQCKSLVSSIVEKTLLHAGDGNVYLVSYLFILMFLTCFLFFFLMCLTCFLLVS